MAQGPGPFAFVKTRPAVNIHFTQKKKKLQIVVLGLWVRPSSKSSSSVYFKMLQLANAAALSLMDIFLLCVFSHNMMTYGEASRT